MAQTQTVLGPEEATRNVVTLESVDHIKTAEIDDRGRFYLGYSFAGDRVEYALLTGGMQGRLHTDVDVDGPIEIRDVDALDRTTVGSGGYLNVGVEYTGEDIVIAFSVIQPAQDSDVENEEAQS